MSNLINVQGWYMIAGLSGETTNNIVNNLIDPTKNIILNQVFVVDMCDNQTHVDPSNLTLHTALDNKESHAVTVGGAQAFENHHWGEIDESHWDVPLNINIGMWILLIDGHDAPSTIYVKAVSNDLGIPQRPWYEFYADVSATTLISRPLKLNLKSSYTFKRTDGSSNNLFHPFYIGDVPDGAGKYDASNIILDGSGSKTDGIIGNQSFKLTFTQSFSSNNKLYWYCTFHSQQMTGEFIINDNVGVQSYSS